MRDHNLAEEKPAESHPGTQPVQNEASTGRDPDASEKPPDASVQVQDATKTPPDETKMSPVDGQGTPRIRPLKIPANIHPAPIAEIDECIRNGYKRDDITAIMKETFGQAYGNVVKQRIAFWKKTHPASRPVTSDTHPVTSNTHPATAPSDIRTTESGSIRNPENTRVLSHRM